MDGDGTVVVVDDEQEFLNLIGEALDEDGFPVICAQCSQDAEDVEGEPSLYLLDLILPDKGGIELARRIRATGHDSPMLAMSSSPEHLVAARDSGLFEDVLSKPFDLDHLLDRVAWLAG